MQEEVCGTTITIFFLYHAQDVTHALQRSIQVNRKEIFEHKLGFYRLIEGGLKRRIENDVETSREIFFEAFRHLERVK